MHVGIILFFLLAENHFSLTRERYPGNTIFSGCQCILCRLLRCSTVSRLEQFENFIIAHLEIRTSRLNNFCCQRRFNHFITILRTLYLQTQLESGITPDLFADLTGRLLSSQNQMHTKASSDTGSTDQFFHKLRKFCPKLGKFIYNNNQMGQRLCNLMIFVLHNVLVDMINLCLCKIILPF